MLVPQPTIPAFANDQEKVSYFLNKLLSALPVQTRTQMLVMMLNTPPALLEQMLPLLNENPMNPEFVNNFMLATNNLPLEEREYLNDLIQALSMFPPEVRFNLLQFLETTPSFEVEELFALLNPENREGISVLQLIELIQELRLNPEEEEPFFNCTDMINGVPFFPYTFTNGACHDEEEPFEGLSGAVHIRTEKPQYVDGLRQPIIDRPSAREISNAVIRQPENRPELLTNIKRATRLLIFFGQFIDHDFALVLEQEFDINDEAVAEEAGSELFPIEIPRNDPNPLFNGLTEMVISRSQFVVDEKGVRQFTSVLTPYLDLGQCYGDDPSRTLFLRAPTGGELRFDPTVFQQTRAEFPPFDNNGPPQCGDRRCGENAFLFTWHALFNRNHNYWARLVASANRLDPIRDNNLIFNIARVKNIIEYQSIVWTQYLSYLLGRRTFEDLTGEYSFTPGVDPTVSLVFTTAIFRYGHSGVSNDIAYLDAVGGNEIRPPLPLASSFMMPRLTFTLPNGQIQDLVGNMMAGQASFAHPRLDSRVVDGIRNSLFANVMPPGFDLPGRNIQRARDHGIDTINQYRIVAGLEPYECPLNPRECFNEITEDEEIADALYELYGNIEECETWPCGMAEDSYLDSLLGETFTFVMAESFQRIRQSDRLWYDNEEVRAEFAGPNARWQPGVRFPVGISTIVDRNTLLMTPPAGNIFVLRPIWEAFAEAERMQVEWFTPRTLAAGYDTYMLTVSPPLEDGRAPVNGVSIFTQPRFATLQRRFSEGVQPETLYTISLTATGPNLPPVLIGETSFMTAAAELVETETEEPESEGGEDAYPIVLSAGAVAGIVIAGIVGVIALIGVVVVFAKRSNTRKYVPQPETFL